MGKWKDALRAVGKIKGHSLQNDDWSENEEKLMQVLLKKIVPKINPPEIFPIFSNRKKTVEPSSSSSPPSSSPPRTSNKPTYDVFLSFRGMDTREGFTGHLYDSLRQRGISTFIDSEELERGERIEELFNYIEASKIFVAVLSKGYADSRWCLREMTKMVECGRLIIPIFFDVDPRDVRKQSGPFQLDKSNEGVGEEDLSKWKDALKVVGKISGYSLQNDTNGNEAQLIRKVVEQISRNLNKTARPITKHLVGMDSHIEKVYRLLDLTDKEVKMIGIVGMGGVGKTTIATVVYNKLLSHFEDSSFISNVRENFKQHNGGIDLQKRLIKDILKDQHPDVADVEGGKSLIKDRFKSKKVLVILDDADHIEQLESLAGERDWFGSRSRIIITSRNSRVLLEHGVKEEHIHRPQVLDNKNSMKLFNSYAFRGIRPIESKYVELSKKVVKKTGGLPLALRVFGSHLWGRNIKEWEEFLKKLLQEPDDHVGGRLMISYEGLQQNVKQIFLDISCFLIGENKEYATYMWEDCGLYPETAITELQNRSLININKHDEFEMHDLLRDMGRGIAQQGEHWQWSRLRNLDDLLQNLAYKDKPRIAEGIVAQGREYTVIKRRGYTKGLVNTPAVLTTQDFVDFSRLRLLHLYGFAFKGEFLCLPQRLKWLRLSNCQCSISIFQPIHKWLSGASNLNAISILELIGVDDDDRILMGLSSSNRKAFNALKVLHIEALFLTKTPDFSKIKMICLRKLTLQFCYRLTEVDGSIGSLKSLVHLELQRCYILQRLPDSICMLMSLETLILINCYSLSSLPEKLGDMKSLRELRAENTGLRAIPDSIGDLSNLRTLSLNENYHLQKLPDSIKMLDSLEELYINRLEGWTFGDGFAEARCTEYAKGSEWLNVLPNSAWEKVKVLALEDLRIPELPPHLGRLTNLEALYIKGENLGALPESLGQLQKRKSFELKSDSLEALPECLGQLQKLKSVKLYCHSLEALPECLGQLQKLESLELRCRNLKALPESLGRLQKLKSLDLKCDRIDSIGEGLSLASSVEELYIWCENIEALPITAGSTLENLKSLELHCSALKDVPDCFASVGRLEELSLSRCYSITFLPTSMASSMFASGCSVRTLNLSCTKISGLPSSMSNLAQLEELRLPCCENLQSLPPLPSSLHVLNAWDCNNLRTISDVSNLKSLKELKLGQCQLLGDFCGLESIAHNLETLELPGPCGGLSGFSQLSPAFMTRVFKEAAFSSLKKFCVCAIRQYGEEVPCRSGHHQLFWITFPKEGRGGKRPTLLKCSFDYAMCLFDDAEDEELSIPTMEEEELSVSIMEEDGHAGYHCTTEKLSHSIRGEEIAEYSVEGYYLKMQVSGHRSMLRYINRYLRHASLSVEYT